ncbi:MAG: serine/threonine protein kinase, partial [Planctomycetes bacterium]|nr:serine/threonine protein kinase [Planctomycetota bacterium]
MDETLPPSKPLWKATTEPPAPPSGQQDQLPKRIGPYEVVHRMGAGSMGIVYRCHDPALNREVAVKVLRHRYAGDEHYQRRFRGEAKAAASLSHNCVVSIHGIHEQTSNEDQTYIIMELVDGESVDALLERDGVAPIADAIRWVRDAASGLREAASKGLIHRDVKPSNLLLTKEGDVKIVDFGLAKNVRNENSLTEEGIVLGTPHYISPEQGRGKPVDHRSDIYSLGATFYHLVTGRPPFEGDSQVSVIVAHVNENPKAPHQTNREIPTSVSHVIFRMMEKSPNDRYSDYTPLIEDLDALLRDETPPHAGGPTPRLRRAFRSFWRRGRAVAAFAAILLLGGLVFTLAAVPRVPSPRDQLQANLREWYRTEADGRVFLDMDFANASHVDMAKTLLRFPAIDTTDPPDVEDNLLQWSTFQGPFAFAVNFDELNEATLSFKEARGNVHLQFAIVDRMGSQKRQLSFRLSPETSMQAPIIRAFENDQPVEIARPPIH